MTELTTLGDVIDAIDSLTEADQTKLFKFLQTLMPAPTLGGERKPAPTLTPPKSSARKPLIVENKPRKKRPQQAKQKSKSSTRNGRAHQPKLNSISAAIRHIGPGAMSDAIVRDIKVRQEKSFELPNDDDKACRAIVRRIRGNRMIIECQTGGYMLKGQQSVPIDIVQRMAETLGTINSASLAEITSADPAN